MTALLIGQGSFEYRTHAPPKKYHLEKLRELPARGADIPTSSLANLEGREESPEGTKNFSKASDKR